VHVVGFIIRRDLGCLSLMSVVFYQVEISALVRSLVRRILASAMCLGVIIKP